jgi:phosphate transport system substrate-binding protein
VPELAQQYLSILGASSVTQKEITPGTEINVEGVFPGENIIRVIEVKAHGTTTGFNSLKAGKCDIVMASRKINPAETKDLAALGDMTDVSCEHVLALDGVAIITHPDNQILSSMDLTMLADIFSEEIDNWSKLGGPNAPIQLHTRDENSGTYEIFRQLVLEDRKLSRKAKRWEANDALSEAVRKDKYAIGFCGLPYVKDNKVLKVSDGSLATPPTTLSVGTEDYPLIRRLHLYTPSAPQNSETINFVAFALGKGQKFITQQKFVPLTIKVEEYAIELIGTIQQAKVINKYLTSVADAKRLSTNYRFTHAESGLDSRGIQDLERMVDFFSDHPFNEIILAGFTDNQGDYWKNYELSCQRAQKVKDAFQSRGITVQKTLCVSEEVPVASNRTQTGRDKNRRVEIWVK